MQEVAGRSITCATVQGHPLAGAIRFLVEERGEALRFEVQTYDRAATLVDRIALATLGGSMKHRTYRSRRSVATLPLLLYASTVPLPASLTYS